MALILQKDSLDMSSGNYKSLREDVEIRNSFFKFLLASSLLLTHWPKQVTCSSPGSALESTNSDMDARMWESLCHGCYQSSTKGKKYSIFLPKETLDSKNAYFEAHIMVHILCKADLGRGCSKVITLIGRKEIFHPSAHISCSVLRRERDNTTSSFHNLPFLV